MKKVLMTSLLAAVCLTAAAQEADVDAFGKAKPEEFAPKSEIVKTGLNFGPLPAVAYDADKGFQIGAVLQIFDYGNGTNYPNYDSKTYLEYSLFTKGSQLIQARYDNKVLIPGVRWSSSLRINLDNAFDFYGFNGYRSNYDAARVISGKNEDGNYLFSPFYRYRRQEFLFKSDFLGRITDHLQWEAGIFANYFRLGEIDYANINKGRDESKMFPEAMPTLYRAYREAGVISEEEADGGFTSGIRLGMVYDSRDKEGAPTRGIWAEAHVTASPKFLSETPYYRYSLTWRNYLPIVRKDVLTFAYRLNYEGTIGDSAPFYVLPYMTVMGEKNDLDGMGGFFTCRGIMRTRVLGLDMATYNAELRWRFVKFPLFNQNIALGLSAFSDGSTVVRSVNTAGLKEYLRELIPSACEDVRMLNADRDSFHVTFGAGFRFIMNENFIVAFEYGTPLSHFRKNSPNYNQDGTGAFYVNLGYLF